MQFTDYLYTYYLLENKMFTLVQGGPKSLLHNVTIAHAFYEFHFGINLSHLPSPAWASPREGKRGHLPPLADQNCYYKLRPNITSVFLN